MDRPTELLTDADLVACMQHGTESAAAEACALLFDRTADPLERTVAARGLVRAEIEDVLQETWARAIARISTYEERGHPFLAWLRGIARNVMLEHGRERPTRWLQGYDPAASDEWSMDPQEQMMGSRHQKRENPR